MLGLRIATTRQVAPILIWLRDCIELCGRPLDLMTDNGGEFVHWIPGVLNRFGKTLRELEIRQIKTQVDSPWTTARSRPLGDAQRRSPRSRGSDRSPMPRRLLSFARYYNLQLPPSARRDRLADPGRALDGTPFTDRGFANVPALAHLEDWLDEIRKAA